MCCPLSLYDFVYFNMAEHGLQLVIELLAAADQAACITECLQ